ncbi:MAG TPA: FtsX-like permease family protein [Gemmataceae bacterium]|jgi:lipoprotein-releasing system permease protein|nr:FtsX-like permease family protein [Gemmataceae bacterium]
MYKALLCWRYLRTRFLAVVCIVSVMLGVATLVVVNSVMAGFSTKLQDRYHGMLSDVIIESPTYNGFPLDTDQMVARIEASPAAAHIEALSPTVEVFGMLVYDRNQSRVTIPVQIVGVDAVGRTRVGGFADYLQDPVRQKNPSFDLTPAAVQRWERQNPPTPVPAAPIPGFNQLPPIDGPPADPRTPNPAIPGFGITHYRTTDAKTGVPLDKPILQPGDSFKLITVGAGKENLEPVHSEFTVADSIKTEMTEIDGRFVYVPLDYVQRWRAMGNRVTHIQIKLKDYDKAPEVVAELRKLFPDEYDFRIGRWEDKQNSLLAAVQMERGLMNLLLFLIVGVAGFCILAIFSMIVREKTRDIGILKSLGASDRGVMQIFVGYGLLLGLIGAVLGTALGLLITYKINPIEHALFKLTGVGFDKNVYYFMEIPTHVEPGTVVTVAGMAILTAVVFSAWPAFRASRLQPVQALRHE